MFCEITCFLFNSIPINIWEPLKKFATIDGRIINLPFKLSAKYTPGLLIILMCLSIANQFFRDNEFDCWEVEIPSFQQQTHENIDRKLLNNYCWNFETFLATRALEPHMRYMVTHPGITYYDTKFDDVITQRYYQFVWLIFAILAVISFLPYFFWQAKARKKLKRLMVITDRENYPEDMQRLNYFLETVGFNETFARFYVGCRIFGTLSPLCQWFLVCAFVGKKFKYYGIEVLHHFLDKTDPWPNPMDIVFPKVAKCKLEHYGFTEIGVRVAICRMPMNNLTQWSFLIYWVWIALVFLINILCLFHLLIHCFGYCRRYRYQKLVRETCRKDFNAFNHKKHAEIDVNLSFGDWLVLSFIQEDMDELKFKDFLQQIATTKNTIIHLQPFHMPVPIFDTFNEVNLKRNQSYANDQKRVPTHREYNNFETQLQDANLGFAKVDGINKTSKPTYHGVMMQPHLQIQFIPERIGTMKGQS